MTTILLHKNSHKLNNFNNYKFNNNTNKNNILNSNKTIFKLNTLSLLINIHAGIYSDKTYTSKDIKSPKKIISELQKKQFLEKNSNGKFISTIDTDKYLCDNIFQISLKNADLYSLYKPNSSTKSKQFTLLLERLNGSDPKKIKQINIKHGTIDSKIGQGDFGRDYKLNFNNNNYAISFYIKDNITSLINIQYYLWEDNLWEEYNINKIWIFEEENEFKYEFKDHDMTNSGYYKKTKIIQPNNFLIILQKKLEKLTNENFYKSFKLTIILKYIY